MSDNGRLIYVEVGAKIVRTDGGLDMAPAYLATIYQEGKARGRKNEELVLSGESLPDVIRQVALWYEHGCRPKAELLAEGKLS